MRTCHKFLRAFYEKFLFTLFSILLISGAVAQETTAVVHGNVSDADGSAVANAEVVVTSRSTGLTKNVRTDSDGNYYVLAFQLEFDTML